ncbi:MAG: GntR family transcriptional regulator [Spirochaetaceae bacterium]|nr:MAG: GntR family transcriptional regulator [Spirochaetaceae bacterium]
MEFREQHAIYQQVADHVCEMILTGAWPEGERIPAVRDLAMELQVNPNTVNKGYASLQERGLIQNQRGIGYFAAPDARRMIRDARRDEFFADELPRILRTMSLLGITIDEIAERYTTYKKEGQP